MLWPIRSGMVVSRLPLEGAGHHALDEVALEDHKDGTRHTTQEHWAGNDTWSLARLQWYASRTGLGFVTPGQAVDWTNSQPLISPAAEPVTGAWYQMAVLMYLNQFDPRLPSYR
jgi:hypothetical protein